MRALQVALMILAACGAVPVAKDAGKPAVAKPDTKAARQALIDEVTRALRGGDFAAAAAAVERARQGKQLDGELIAYFDATVHAYQEDFAGAARVMAEHVARVGPMARGAFAFHDAMIALRTATGDLTGALIECEEMVQAGTRGTWTSTDPDRVTLVRLKEHWHRAYLLRMIVQARGGAERQTLIDYAENARRDYVAVAAPLKTADDSIAVLDAYFAFCDGDAAKMREAAQRVHVAEDDDVEDLYLVQLALDGAGDHAAAAAIRDRIRKLDFVTVLTPVFLAWMRDDEAGERFSPKHPTGR